MSKYFQITTTRHFHAGHALRLYDGTMEQVHEHDWRVQVTVGAPKLDAIGVVMDFHELERLVDEILGSLGHGLLNDLPAFAQVNPSAEQVACHIADSLKLPPGIALRSVEVWETDGNSALCAPSSRG